MARMYPEKLPDEVRNNPMRQAEVRLYDGFAEQLDNEYHVFYSVSWLGRTTAGNSRDGETDFVILHSRKGMLTLEVKGGIISYDGRRDQWSSRNRFGNVNVVKNPIRQARDGKYTLREKIVSLPGWVPCNFAIGHAIGFPDCTSDAEFFTPDLDRSILLLAPDCAGLDTWLDGVYTFWQRKHEITGDLGEDRVSLVVGALAPTFELPNSLAAAIRADDAQILRMTDQQFLTLDFIGHRRRAAVSGGAGCGKTVLALEKARRLAAEGFETLLTCFNRKLAEFLRTAAGDKPRLTIRTYHHVCSEFAELAGIPLPPQPAPEKPLEVHQRYWNEDHTDALMEARALLPERRFDAIVVDEGQDFDGAWWGPVQSLLRDEEDGILYVFHDDNQRIYKRDTRFPDLDQAGVLGANTRNTRSIHDVIKNRFGLETMSLGPPGEPVEWVQAETASATRKAVAGQLDRLIQKEGLAPGDIAVLTGLSRERSCLGKEGVIGTHRVASDDDGDGAVLLTTIHSFKGLDKPAVILTEIDRQVEKGYSEVVYVGVTRARSFLVVVGKRKTLDWLRNDVGASASG